MTNRERYKRAFSVLHVSENFSLERRDTESKKAHKHIGITAVVLAAVLVLGIGAYAFGQSRILHLRGEQIEEFNTASEFNDSSTRILDATVPEGFSNGFTFAPGSKQMIATAEFEDGDETSFDLLSAHYIRGDASVSLNLCRDLGRSITNPDYVSTTLAGATVYCFDGPEILSTKEVDEPDALDYQLRTVVWFADGMMYQIHTMDPQVEMAELMEMAAELIEK